MIFIIDSACPIFVLMSGLLLQLTVVSNIIIIYFKTISYLLWSDKRGKNARCQYVQALGIIINNNILEARSHSSSYPPKIRGGGGGVVVVVLYFTLIYLRCWCANKEYLYYIVEGDTYESSEDVDNATFHDAASVVL